MLRIAEGVAIEAGAIEIGQAVEIVRRELIVRELRMRHRRCAGGACRGVSHQPLRAAALLHACQVAIDAGLNIGVRARAMRARSTIGKTMGREVRPGRVRRDVRCTAMEASHSHPTAAIRSRRVEAAAARVEPASAHARRATHGMETAAATVKTAAATVKTTAAAVESAATAAVSAPAPATTTAAAAVATAAVAGSRCIGRQSGNHRRACQKSEGKFVFHVTPSSLQRRPLPHASRHSTTSKTVRRYAGFPLSPVNFEQGCAAASGTSPIVAAGAFLQADVIECEGAGAAKMRLLVDRKGAGHCCARNDRLRKRKSKRP
jgi:hypothetical protein